MDRILLNKGQGWGDRTISNTKSRERKSEDGKDCRVKEKKWINQDKLKLSLWSFHFFLSYCPGHKLTA